MHLKMSFGKWRPFCLGLSVLTYWVLKKMDEILLTTFGNVFSRMKIPLAWLEFDNMSALVKKNGLPPYGASRPQWVNSIGCWCIYKPVKWVIISSGNDMLPVRHQTIPWTNSGSLSIETVWTNFSEIESLKIQKYFKTHGSEKTFYVSIKLLIDWLIEWNRIKIQNIFQENSHENVICKMSTILFRPQCVYGLWQNRK